MDIDLEKFFDRVNHDMLMGRVAKRVTDKRLLKLIRAFLNAGVMENGLVSPTEEGTPQGGPLSPLLSNLMLDDLDRELERRGHRFVRYADDCNIYVRSERAGQRVMESIEPFHHQEAQAQGQRGEERGGQTAGAEVPGLQLHGRRASRKRRIAPKALEPVQGAGPGTDAADAGASACEQMVEQLTHYLIGWRGYFGFCQTPVGAERPGLVDPTTAPLRRLEAVEAGPDAVRGTDDAAAWAGPGGPNRREPPRPVADQPQPRPQHRTAECLLQTRSACLASRLGDRLTSRTAVYGPVRTVV